MRLGRTKGTLATRLCAAVVLSCALIAPASAVHGESLEANWAPSSTGSGHSVQIVILTPPPLGPEGWSTEPVRALVVPSGPGETWYRIGPAPGPWTRCDGPIAVPSGKQTLSAVLVGEDGVAGPVAETVVRSDYHLHPLTSVGALVSTTPPASATFTGSTSVGGTVQVIARIRSQYGTTMHRLGGKDRYGTGQALSSSGFTRAPTVIIATGEKFPDALTASGLAGCLNAPVLLVRKNFIPPQTTSELRRLHTRHVIICGGPPAVSDAVASKFRGMGISVERLAGKTRYETAIAVSQKIQKLTGRHDRVFFARGDWFADALIVSPLAYASRTPILLTTRSALNPTVATRLTQAKYQHATIVGGVGGRAEGGIRNRVIAVDRWGGSDQYDTSVQVAAQEVLEGGVTWSYVGIARGDLFPDALCGGALAGKHAGVILLTPPTSLYPEVADALTAHAGEVRMCEVYGSEKAVSAPVYQQIQAIFH